VEALYAEYGATVYRYLLLLLGDQGAAEDVLQKVFTEVWSRGGSYDPERGNVLGWILQIARSRAIDHTRKRVPDPVDPGEMFPTESRSGDGFTDELIDRWQIAHMLERLPREESELLRARFYLGMSQTEIAADTGLALGTVKMRMVDGLRRLRSMLEEEGTAL
jgi:RNA polymerase sigma-70 factor (ECF subfamily)